MLIFISCFSLFVFLPATELSLLLREMILKLFSEHLSADGKVMLSLMLTECMLLFCKCNSAFGSVPHSVYCCTGQAVCSYEVSLWQTEKTCLQTFLLFFTAGLFVTYIQGCLSRYFDRIMLLCYFIPVQAVKLNACTLCPCSHSLWTIKACQQILFLSVTVS